MSDKEILIEISRRFFHKSWWLSEHFPVFKRLFKELGMQDLLEKHLGNLNTDFDVPEALSQASVIVEASDTSGTLFQARAAIKQNRKLFILDSCFQKYQWPFNFEKKGAIRVKDEKDILSHLKKS